MVDHGAKLVGVVEIDGSIFREEGLNPLDVFEYVSKNKGITGYEKADEIYADHRVAYQECDIFAPAVLEWLISSENANRF